MRARKTTPAEDIFLLLPKDIRILLCTYLCSKDWLCLILASRSFLPAYPLLAKQADFPLRRLLNHITLGEWEDADSILEPAKQSPCLTSFLLSCPGTVFHKNSNRHKAIQLTCWQIALINEELEEAERLGESMTEAEKRKQFMEVFPTGKMVKYNWDAAKAKKLLLAVFTAIIHDETINRTNLGMINDDTKTALNELYDYVKPSQEHKTGLVFDANFYLEALQLYQDHIDEFKNRYQCSFWCVRVEEHLAALLGTGYLRLHARGRRNAITRGGCILEDGSSYFSFRRTDSLVAGLHFFVGFYGVALSLSESGMRLKNGLHGRVFTEHMSDVKKQADKLMQRYSRQQNPSKCVVC